MFSKYLPILLLPILSACVTNSGSQPISRAQAEAEVAIAQVEATAVMRQTEEASAAATQRAQIAYEQAKAQESNFATAVAHAAEVGNLQATAVYSPVLQAQAQAEAEKINADSQSYVAQQAIRATEEAGTVSASNNVRNIGVLGCFALMLGAVIMGLWIMLLFKDRTAYHTQLALEEVREQKALAEAAEAQTRATVVQAQVAEAEALRKLIETLPDGQRAIFSLDHGRPTFTIVPIMGNGDRVAPTMKIMGQSIGRLDGLSDRDLVLAILRDAIRTSPNGARSTRIPSYDQLPDWSGGKWQKATDMLVEVGVITKRQGEGTFLTEGMNLGTLYNDIQFSKLVIE